MWHMTECMSFYAPFIIYILLRKKLFIRLARRRWQLPTIAPGITQRVSLLLPGDTAWERNRKKLELKVSRRGVEVLDLTVQLVKDDITNGIMYRPTLVLKLVQNPYANLQGKFAYFFLSLMNACISS